MPTLPEVIDYVKNNNLAVNPNRFFAYYKERAWKTSKGTPIDWKEKILVWDYDDKKKNEAEAKTDPSYDADEFFEAALRAGIEKEPAKTAADDEGIRERMEKLKERLGN